MDTQLKRCKLWQQNQTFGGGRFSIFWKLSYYKIKIDCYVLCTPHDKNKAKANSGYTKDNEKGIKAYHYSKTIKSQRKRVKEKERNKGITKQPENNQQNGSNKSILSIITLNVSRLNSPIRRHSVSKWIKKTTNQLSPAKNKTKQKPTNQPTNNNKTGPKYMLSIGE